MSVTMVVLITRITIVIKTTLDHTFQCIVPKFYEIISLCETEKLISLPPT